MLSVPTGSKIFIYTGVADMRKGFSGLCGIVRETFGADPTDGSLFIFVNRRRDRMKLLQFADGGFWLYYRLLEAGMFELIQPRDNQPQRQIDATELAMLLAGVSLAASSKRRKRFVA